MEAEVNRILDLLAEGKIDVAEAERLILALKQPSTASEHADRKAERPIQEPISRLDREARAATRRLGLLCHRIALSARCREQAQRRARARLGVEDRLRWILTERALVEPAALGSDARLGALMADPSGRVCGERLAWEVLRLGIEDEFGQTWTVAELQAVETLADLVARVEGRAQPDAPAEEQPPQADAAEEPAAPEPPTPDTPSDGQAK
jgi:hypothetical protein